MKQEFKTQLLLGLFVMLLVGMNLLGGKLMPFLGLSASVAIFMVPLTFLITDIVEEVHGRAEADRFVTIGVLTLVVLLLYVVLFVHLPPAERYTSDPAYREVFGQSARILIASIVAFGVSQFHDVWAFRQWKKATKGKFLWLRNNLSTIVSQTIDSFLFMFIAFYMVSPTFTAGFVVSITIPYLLLKILMAAVDTPLVYLGVRWLRGKPSTK